MNANRVLSLLPFTAMSVTFALLLGGCSQSGPGAGPATTGSGGTSASSSNDSGNGGSTAKTGKTSGSSSKGGKTSSDDTAEGGGNSEGGASSEGGSESGGTSSAKSSAVKTGGSGGKASSGVVGSSAGGTRTSGSATCSGSTCANGGSNAGGTVGSSTNTTVPNGGATVCGAEHFKDFASGKTPKEVGLKLAKLFDSQAVDTTKHYKTACTWWGALTVTGLLKDATLDSLIKKFETLVPNFVATSTERNHVDDNIFGIVPMEIFLQNGDKATRDLGLALADHQIQNINDPNQKRMAIDDMFMITELQIQAYRSADADKKAKYLDFIADVMVEYLAMQQDDGCFYQKEGANAKWGRGNGWFAVGMAEMMRELPSTHKHYAKIRSSYEKMMKGLLDYQIKSGEGAGIWYQVIDSTDSRNWPETSGSAMFAYAMITGVKLCILDAATYGPAALAAWNTLTDPKYLGADGKLKEISDWCYWQQSEGDALTYYVTIDGRTRVVGDGHGQGPMLWSAAALLR